jgi:hypothetical protein
MRSVEVAATQFRLPPEQLLPLKQRLRADFAKVRDDQGLSARQSPVYEMPMTSRKKSNPPWQRLERHFAHHKALVIRFRTADAPLVRHMWRTQTNEVGAPLSADERQALRERHCELFGCWPPN